jgi:hypothetical protein
MKFQFSRQILEKKPKYYTGSRTDMTKLRVALRNFANAPKTKDKIVSVVTTMAYNWWRKRAPFILNLSVNWRWGEVIGGPQNQSGRVRKILPPPGFTVVFSCSLFVLRISFFVPIVLYFGFVSLLTSLLTQTPTPPRGFEPATPASDRSHTLALDRSVTGIGGFDDRTAPARSESLYRLSYHGPRQEQQSALDSAQSFFTGANKN